MDKTNKENETKQRTTPSTTNCTNDYGTDEHCTCDKHHYDEDTCPFTEEIYGDTESLCNCCPYCKYQCAMDI